MISMVRLNLFWPARAPGSFRTSVFVKSNDFNVTNYLYLLFVRLVGGFVRVNTPSVGGHTHSQRYAEIDVLFAHMEGKNV